MASAPQPLQIWPGAAKRIAMYGESTGSIEVTTVTGGVAPYVCKWVAQDGSSVPRPTSLGGKVGMKAGLYLLTVTDQEGTVATQTFEITQQAKLSVLAGSIKHIKVYAQKTGRILSSSVKGGSGVYTSYTWSDPSFAPDLEEKSGLAAGEYTLSITDSLGAQTTHTFVVQQAAPIAIAPGTMSFVKGSGAITASTFAGGSGNFVDITWTMERPYHAPEELPAKTPAISGLILAKYTLRVTDSDGGQASHTFDLNTVKTRR